MSRITTKTMTQMIQTCRRVQLLCTFIISLVLGVSIAKQRCYSWRVSLLRTQLCFHQYQMLGSQLFVNVWIIFAIFQINKQLMTRVQGLTFSMRCKDLIAAAEHLPRVFRSNFSAGVVNGSASCMEFVESPELFPTVHQIDAMDAKDSSERMHYFASLFILTYVATVVLGTCIMTLGPKCGGGCGGRVSSNGWHAMEAIEAMTDHAKADTRPKWEIRDDEIESRKVHQRWQVTAVFSSVFCLSFAAAIFSLKTDRLSKRFGSLRCRSATLGSVD